jgi:hypothetical protein
MPFLNLLAFVSLIGGKPCERAGQRGARLYE